MSRPVRRRGSSSIKFYKKREVQKRRVRAAGETDSRMWPIATCADTRALRPIPGGPGASEIPLRIAVDHISRDSSTFQHGVADKSDDRSPIVLLFLLFTPLRIEKVRLSRHDSIAGETSAARSCRIHKTPRTEYRSQLVYEFSKWCSARINIGNCQQDYSYGECVNCVQRPEFLAVILRPFVIIVFAFFRASSPR